VFNLSKYLKMASIKTANDKELARSRGRDAAYDVFNKSMTKSQAVQEYKMQMGNLELNTFKIALEEELANLKAESRGY